jgi:phosphatidylglycerophosphate synthase
LARHRISAFVRSPLKGVFMAILASDLFQVPPRRPLIPTPLFRDASLHMALFGGGLGAALLGALAGAALSWRGMIAALLCYGLMVLLTLGALVRHHHPSRFGLANAITLGRAAITAALFGLFGEWLLNGVPSFTDLQRWSLAFMAGLILILDGLDGPAARRSGLASPFGAWFDMEADALFVLSLYLLVMAAGIAGPWVLACGALRYLFILAGQFDDRHTAPLPALRRRKAIYVVQAGAPIVALTPFCPAAMAAPLCAAAFAFVLYSFGADCLWLLTRDPETLAIRSLRL